MARNDAAIGKITPRADEINTEKQVLGEQMPEIKYFVPGYNPALVIKDGDDNFIGIKTPWFSSALPGGADAQDYHIYDPVPLNIGEITNALEYDDGGIQTLRCDIKPGFVSRIVGVGDAPTRLRIVLDKRVNEYEHAYTGGNEANVFYVMDENEEIIMIIHAHGFTFVQGRKWEIVQELIYTHADPITAVEEDPNPFHFKTAAEILLPDIIVGSDQDRLDGRAGHTMSEFSDPGLDLAGKRALFLPGVGPLTENVVKNGDEISLKMLGESAVIDLAGHTLTFTGNNVKGDLRVINAGADSLIIPGSKIDLAVQSDNDAAADFTGDGLLVVNGNVYCRNVSAGDLTVGTVTASGDIQAQSLDINGQAAIDDAGNISGQNLDINGQGGIDSAGDVSGQSLTVSGTASADVLEATSGITLGGTSVTDLISFAGLQPDRFVVTAAEQGLQTSSPRILRYDQASHSFLDRDENVVADNGSNPFPEGEWIMVGSLETLSAGLYFKGNSLKIETDRKFEISPGDMGDGIPWPIFIRGDNCLVDLWLDRSMKDLKDSLGDDKYTIMSNGLDQLENRRVIKNQGRGNRISYNNEKIFSGHEPMTCVGFSMPDNPYCLEWDNFGYEGAERPGVAVNALKCWFWEMYQALDRRFNAALPFPVDDTDLWLTVRTPPREAYFFRATDGGSAQKDPDRHSRLAWDRYGAGAAVETIPSGTYSQSGDIITLTGNQAHNIKKVRDGIRVQDADGGLPQAPDPENPGYLVGTTIVRPGSINRTGSSQMLLGQSQPAYSFRVMNAETGAGETGASGSLTLDFSGMAGGSTQKHAMTGHRHDSLGGSYWVSGPAAGHHGGQNYVRSNQSTTGDPVTDTINGDPETASEDRPVNMLIIHYYRP